MLLDFTTYSGLNGTLDQQSFEASIAEAESYIHYITFDRIVSPTASVQRALVEIVKLIDDAKKRAEMIANSVSENEGRIVRAVTAGATRVEYQQTESREMYSQGDNDLDRLVYKVCLRWLGHTGLMYRGQL